MRTLLSWLIVPFVLPVLGAYSLFDSMERLSRHPRYGILMGLLSPVLLPLTLVVILLVLVACGVPILLLSLLGWLFGVDVAESEAALFWPVPRGTPYGSPVSTHLARDLGLHTESRGAADA
jgi:hypothetical protein